MKVPSRRAILIAASALPVLLVVVWNIARSSLPATIRGRLRHEPFYAGAPVSWWIERAKTPRFHLSDIFAPHGPAAEISEQAEAVQILIRMGTEGHQEVIPVLIQLLGNKYVGKQAVEGLGRIGKDAAPAVPYLIQFIKDPRERYLCGQSASKALAQIDVQSAIDVLTDLLEAQSRPERCWAADRLGEIGPQAKAAIPQLKKLLDEASTHQTAQSAIQKIEPEN